MISRLTVIAPLHTDPIISEAIIASARNVPIQRPLPNRVVTKPTNWIVLKFGGSSVSEGSLWENIAHVLRSHLTAGRRPLVVHSAFSGVTNALEALVDARLAGVSATGALKTIEDTHARMGKTLGVPHAELIGDILLDLRGIANLRPEDITPMVRARALSAGERMATRMSAAWLNRVGVRTRWLDARDLLKADGGTEADQSSNHFLSATCDFDEDRAFRHGMSAFDEPVLLTQGFVASDKEGRTVVLGRGGSDTSAAYLASKIGASRLEIWTDVPGTFTTNPRIVSDARLIKRVGISEVSTMAALGAKVLHPRSLAPAHKAQIPLHVRWTRYPELGTGTHIVPDTKATKAGVKAIGLRDHVWLLEMSRPASWQPVGFMSDVASRFADARISMDLVSSSPSSIKATIDLQAFPGARDDVEPLLESLRETCDVRVDENVTCVSLVGHRTSADVPQLFRSLSLLKPSDIQFAVHAADDRHMSYVVRNEVAEPLLAALHSGLFSERDACDVFGESWTQLQRRASARPQETEAVTELAS